MNSINFTAKDNFPLSSDGMDLMQQMIHLGAKLARLGGQNYILSGCSDVDGVVSDGVIVINGEILPFVGGEKKDNINIVEEKMTLIAFDELYPEAYIKRHVEFDDAGDYNWADFVQVLTNKELQEKFESIKGTPLGIPEMWVGYIGKIPENYRLCDGSELSQEEYPELFDAIGTLHGNASPGYFRLPDMRDIHPVGYNNNNPDYSIIGTKGGNDKVTMQLKNTPKHAHVYTDDTNAAGKFTNIEPGFPTIYQGAANEQSSAESRGVGTAYMTSKVGGNDDGSTEPIDVRSKYMVTGFIIKVKY